MTLSAGILSPSKQIEASGNVIDMIIYQDDLVAGTTAGTLEVYDTKTYEQKLLIPFGQITDFMGDIINPKVFSVDYDASSNSYIAVLQASNGSRELLHVKDSVKTKLIDAEQKLYISKAKFVDANRVLLALLSNEIILFDIKNKKDIYRFQVNFSHFSDLKLNENKTQAVNGCESGEISVINIEKGEVSKVLKGGNVDNVYKVDIKNGFALGAGQDRRGIVYDIKDGSYKRFDSSFLIYSGALSPSAERVAFSFGENNDIAVFDRNSLKRLHTLKGQKSTLNTIVFQNENVLFSSSDDRYIMKWELNK
jgi:WD40 repeat protein